MRKRYAERLRADYQLRWELSSLPSDAPALVAARSALTENLAGLAAGQPVVVTHGWQVGRPGLTGPLRLEADGTVTPISRAEAGWSDAPSEAS